MDSAEPRKDFLTGFQTRESLVTAINELRSNYDTYKKAFSVLLLDIDHFKSFNDKFGHLIGDEVLKYFSSSIRLDLVAEQTSLFRFGGDEFLILFHAADAEESADLATRLLDNIRARPCNIRGNQLKMSFSAGIASYPTDGRTAEELLEKADKALYESKKNGRGRVTQYSRFRAKMMRFISAGVAVALAVLLIGIGFELGLDRKAMDLFQKTPRVVSAIQKTSLDLISRFEGWKSDLSRRWEGYFTPKPLIGQAITSTIQDDLETYLNGQVPHNNRPTEPEAEIARQPSPAQHEVHLKNGGVVRGRVLWKSGDRITIEFESGAGRGTVLLKTADIDRIEEISPPSA